MGQTINLGDLVGTRHEDSINFVDLSRQKEIAQLKQDFADLDKEVTDEEIAEIAERRLYKICEAAMQTIQYQLVTIMTTNGQAPFVSVWCWIGETDDKQKQKDLAMLYEIMLKQRILGVKNRQGVYVAPAFPKILYALDENNITEDSEYWYLTELSAECTTKRLVPDYISVKKMKELKNGDVYPCMGCRSFLTPDIEGFGVDGEHQYYGRFNIGVVTLNLVDIACSSGKDEKLFWEIFEDRMEHIVRPALQIRHKHLLGTVSDVAPIMWQDGALARLQPGETIDDLLYNNYCTLSIGYAGLAETVFYMTGSSHTDDKEGTAFGLRVMQFLNDKAALWRKEENISYSVYGTPIESVTYKFAKALQQRFGIIKDVTDHNYITNSYHVSVRENISAFDKIRKEAVFQALSPGGAITYTEVPDMQHNVEAILDIIKYMYDTILYAEINTKSDYCMECGYDGEIQIVTDDNGKLVWECPNCECRDQSKMYVTRRTCGYIGTQYWNQGRTQEIQDRVLHVSTEE